MADVFAVFGTLLALGIAFPGLLAAFWLLFPARVETSRLRLEKTPWACVWMGVAALLLIGMPAFVLLALPISIAKLAGSLVIFLALCSAAVGAAGIASLMGSRISGPDRKSEPSLGEFVKGAIALELAAIFPVLGWVVILPLAILVSLGAASFAVLGWQPRLKAEASLEPQTTRA
jgi:hypothetical protein